MKRPSNKIIGIYLIWLLIHFTFLFSNDKCENANEIFYPFTAGSYVSYGGRYDFGSYKNNFVLNAYDISEFIFYNVSVIIIYFIVSLLGLSKFFSLKSLEYKQIDTETKREVKNSKLKTWFIKHLEKSNSSDWSTQISFIKYLLIIIVFSFCSQLIDVLDSKSIYYMDFDFKQFCYTVLELLLIGHVLFFVFLVLRFLLLKLIFNAYRNYTKFSFWMPIPYIQLLLFTFILLVVVAMCDRLPII